MKPKSRWRRSRLLFSSAVTSIRVHHWVLWWFGVGLVCGAVALVNIFFRDLTRTQERVILLLGVLHWVLGGLVCYGLEGIQIVPSGHRSKQAVATAAESSATKNRDEREWHAASEFVMPGRHI